MLLKRSTQNKSGKKSCFKIAPGKIFIIAAAALVLLCFLFQPSLYTTGSIAKGNLSIGKKRLLIELFLTALPVFLVVFREKISRLLGRAGVVFSVLMTLSAPVVSYFCTNFLATSMHNNKKIVNLKIPMNYVALNMAIILLLFLLFLVITNNLRSASVLCVSFSVFAVIACYMVFKFRGVPLIATDLAAIATAATVAGSYSYQLSIRCILIIQFALIYAAFFSCLPPCRLFSGRRRLVFDLAVVIILGISVNRFFFSDYLKKQNIAFDTFKPQRTYANTGFFLTFARSFQYLRLEKPENYDIADVNEIAADYPSDSVKDADGTLKPNVIIVMNESFSDLAVNGNIPTSEDYMPFFRSLKENTVRGYTYCSILGGGTANTEFEVLTGNSLILLSDKAYAFNMYIKKPMASIASLLDSLGYQGLYAVHPYQATNYSRSVVYPLLGFHTYISRPDFASDVLHYHNFIADEAVYDVLIEKYEESKQQSDLPFFFYTMTMQNHGGYNNADKYPYLLEPVELTETKSTDVQLYLNLIKRSDDALERLITYFEGVDDPTIIVFAGDHQPAVEDKFLNKITDGAYANWTDEEYMNRYAVPFIFWANYDIEEKTDVTTSMNYLQTVLFDTLDFPMTGYQKYSAELMKEIPVITTHGYWGADGNFYALDDETSPYYDRLSEYKTLLYNNISDIKNRPDHFYELSD